MSLRTRLILVFGALMGLLIGAEWLLVTALTHDLKREMAEVAYNSSARVLGSVFPRIDADLEAPLAPTPRSAVDGPPPTSFRMVGPGLHPHRSRHQVRIYQIDSLLELTRGAERREPDPSVEADPEAMQEEILVLTLHDSSRPDPMAGPPWLFRGLERPGESGHEDDLRLHLWVSSRASLNPGSGVLANTPVTTSKSPQSTSPQSPPPTTAGVEIPIPSEGIEAANRRWLRRMVLGSAAILGLGLIAATWLAHRITRPLRDLGRAARELGEGALGTQVKEAGAQEVDEAIQAFNQMSRRLAALDAEAARLREREHLTEIGELARGLAHALRNPLHMLGLSVDELARRGEDARGNEARAELADAARGQILRIDRSLRSFLALASGFQGEPEEVRIDDLARDVALEILQGPGGAAVKVECDAPCTLRGIAAELRAVLHVLVVNAVEAGGDQPVGVRVTCEGEVRVEVTDRGAGLAEEVRRRLFTPHVTTKPQGAGMGLFLAQRIATNRYGGRLSLEDRPGGGTLAVLVLRDRREQPHETPDHG